MMEWFWEETFWLPSNVSWTDLKDTESEKYPHVEDFSLVLPFAVFLLVCRFLFERWRFACYACLFLYGVTNIPKEAWFWNLRLCWLGFPMHTITTSMSNLYFFELSFYVSLILSAPNDVKRKDFYPMFCHHIFTSLLILFSWVCNFVRIGCIIIVIHDIADVFLEAAKALNYAKWSLSAHVMFAGFVLSFFVARIIYLPFWVMHSSMVTSWEIIGPFPAWFLFNGLLVVMLSLNGYWFFYISKMVLKLIFEEKKEKGHQDIRSEDDGTSSDMESPDEEPTKEVGPNGDYLLNSNHNVIHRTTVPNGTT